MTPDFKCTIEKIDYGPTPNYSDLPAIAAAVAARIPQLENYRGALVDIINDNQDEEIEIYNIPDMNGEYVSSTNGTHLLFMPLINRAALNSYQAGDWQWTDACSPDEALERYRTNTMMP